MAHIRISWIAETVERGPDGGDAIDSTFEFILIDGAISETYRKENEMSQHPVARGSDFTDNIRNLNVPIDIMGVISNDPYDDILNEENHVRVTVEALESLFDRKQIVSIETDDGLYEDYHIFRMSRTRSASIGDGQDINLSARKVPIANTETTERPAPTVERTRPAQDSGSNQPAATGSTATATPGGRGSQSSADRQTTRSAGSGSQRTGS